MLDFFFSLAVIDRPACTLQMIQTQALSGGDASTDKPTEYVVTQEDVRCQLVFAFKVRKGKWVYSEPTSKVAGGPEDPPEEEEEPAADAVAAVTPGSIENATEDPNLRLQLPAVAIEGVPLMPTLVNVEVDHCKMVVGWSRRSRELFSSRTNDDESGDVLVSRELVYTPTAEDVGFILLCTVCLSDHSLRGQADKSSIKLCSGGRGASELPDARGTSGGASQEPICMEVGGSAQVHPPHPNCTFHPASQQRWLQLVGKAGSSLPPCRFCRVFNLVFCQNFQQHKLEIALLPAPSQNDQQSQLLILHLPPPPN